MRRRSAFAALAAIAFAAATMACPPEPPPLPPTDFDEDLVERYLERYDPASGPIESWVYDGDGGLREYSQYTLSDGYLVQVDSYSSSAVTDDSTRLSRVSYEYDEYGDAVHGEIWTVQEGLLSPSASFDASYDAWGQYTDYLERDGTGAVTEHRVCVYDPVTGYYLTETYYRDAGTADKIEEYVCGYAPDDPYRWIRESHYIKISGTDPGTFFETNVTHEFSWAGGTMYQQTDFSQSGDMIAAILYTFQNGRRKTRSKINQDGRVASYRSYEYDGSGFRTELRDYRFDEDPEGILAYRESSRLYAEGGNNYYEKCLYTGPASKSPSVGEGIPPSTATALSPIPKAVHWGE